MNDHPPANDGRTPVPTPSLARLAILSERSTLAMVLTDADGRIEWVNPAFTTLTGFALDEILGRTPDKVLEGPATDADAVRQMREAIGVQRAFEVEVENFGTRGLSYSASIQAQPLYDESGRMDGYAVLVSDVTAQREAREAANRAKSELMANMSREMHSRLNAIIGMTSLLAGTSLDRVQRDHLDVITTSSRALLETVNDLLDVSRLEAGHVGIERRGPSEAAGNAAPRASKGTVLVVEDNVASQKVARSRLLRLGWSVETAANGREALERVQAESFDAILMDCQMPVMDGFIATERIRKIEGTARHTPIIALTAGASMTERARCLEAGMDDFLPKPIREEALDAALTRWALHAGGVGQELVDRAILGRLRGLPGEQGGDLIGELTEMLAERVDGVALMMRDEARQRRLEVVVREAHGLKGLVLTLGATSVADRCRDIETAATDGNVEQIPSLVDAFERSWLETLPQLRAARRWILEEGDSATSPAPP